MAVSSVWNEARSGGIPAGFLFGLTMSTAGASNTLTVAPGFCADSTGLYRISLSAALAKTMTIWAAGAGGGLDTGTIANNTWYHWYAIFNPTTGASDVLFSINWAVPTGLPAGFTVYRRIGAAKTNALAQWVKFVQIGDRFLWDVPTTDIEGANLTTTSTLGAINVPTGISVLAAGEYTLAAPSAVYLLLSSPLAATQVVSTPNGNYTASWITGNIASTIEIMTNVNQQIRYVANVNGVGAFYWISTGYTDTRGRAA
jgi:hypothetical protein